MNLEEVIDDILCIGKLSEIRERAFNAFRDYLSYKFESAIVKAEKEGDEKTAKALKDLFYDLIRKEIKT